MHLIFLCVANSARSQIAEGIAKQILGSSHVVESAGSKPSAVNPSAIQVMREINIDISSQHSKSIESIKLDQADYVFTLCQDEVCPRINTDTCKHIHWPIPDPAGQPQELEAFRNARQLISNLIKKWHSTISE